MKPTLDEQIEWLETGKVRNGPDGLRELIESTLATLRQVKAGQQAEPVAWGIKITVAGQEMWDYIAHTRTEANDHINSWLASDEFQPEAHRLVPLYATPQPAPDGWVLRRSDVNGNVVAVTRTDEDHQVLSVIWEKPERKDCPHAAPFRYCPECKVSPCPIGFDAPAAPESK